MITFLLLLTSVLFLSEAYYLWYDDLDWMYRVCQFGAACFFSFAVAANTDLLL